MKDRLQKIKEMGLFRSLSCAGNLIDLTSNDYFGFARSADMLEKAHQKIDRIGSTGSRLLTGNYPLFEELEKKIANFHHAEECLIYSTGYMANLGLLSALGKKGVSFIYDLAVHASFYDGMRLSNAKCVPFRHNEIASLEDRLKKAVPPVYVLTESIYSMSGTVAPLQSILELCRKYGAELIVDEAHATGVRGSNGEGLCVELGLQNFVFARIHTFSKALGTHGAAVLGSCLLKEYLINFSRPLIYSTALPPPALALIACAYEKLQ